MEIMKPRLLLIAIFASLSSGCVYVDEFTQTFSWNGQTTLTSDFPAGVTFHVSLPDVCEGQADTNSLGGIFFTHHRRYRGPNRVRIWVAQDSQQLERVLIHRVEVRDPTSGDRFTLHASNEEPVACEFKRQGAFPSCAFYESSASFQPAFADRKKFDLIVDLTLARGTDVINTTATFQMTSHENRRRGLDLAD